MLVPHGPGCAFLFGGPMAGKSTVFTRIFDILDERSSTKRSDGYPVLPVYLELRQLGEDYGSPAFYTLLLEKANQALAKVDPNLASPPPPGFGIGSFDPCAGFIRALSSLLARCDSCRPNLYFLLDDCKRLTCLPQGFEEGLVHVLWGKEHALKGRIAMAFAGDQSLRKFFVDRTTSLSVRSCVVNLENLEDGGLQQMAESLHIAQPTRVLRLVSHVTGGHAGLSWHLLQKFAKTTETCGHDTNQLIREFCESHQNVVRAWHGKLSSGARLLQSIVLNRGAITRLEANEVLYRANSNSSLDEWACDELLFTGIVTKKNDEYRKAGTIYWDYLRNCIPDERPVVPHEREAITAVGKMQWPLDIGEDKNGEKVTVCDAEWLVVIAGSTPFNLKRAKILRKALKFMFDKGPSTEQAICRAAGVKQTGDKKLHRLFSSKTKELHDRIVERYPNGKLGLWHRIAKQ